MKAPPAGRGLLIMSGAPTVLVMRRDTPVIWVDAPLEMAVTEELYRLLTELGGATAPTLPRAGPHLVALADDDLERPSTYLPGPR